MYFLPYLIFFGIYLLLSTQTFSTENKKLSTFLSENPSDKWIKGSFDIDGPFYQISTCIALRSFKEWKEIRMQMLKRLIVTANTHHFNSKYDENIEMSFQTSILGYDIYKPYLMFWAFIDLSYSFFNQCDSTNLNEDWTLMVSYFVCCIP